MNLPSSWTHTTLGAVVDYGATTKVEPHEIADDAWVLELEDVEKDTSRLLGRFSCLDRKPKSTKNRFSAGDVLYGKLRPYLNKVLMADRPGVCTTEIIPLDGRGTVDNRFLFYWLKHPRFLDYVNSVSHGVNMPRLGTEAGRAAPFVVAPLPEQKRIAEKLDSVLARVYACRDRLDRIPALLKRIRQSVLAAAMSGRLTATWREERSEGLDLARFQLREILERRSQSSKKVRPAMAHLKHEEFDIPNEWIWTSLDALTARIVDGTHHTPTYELKGIPFVSVKDIRDGRIDLSDTKFISETEHVELSRRCPVSKGDLLITKSGTIGRTAIVDTDTPFSLFVSVAVIKPACEKVNLRFIEMVLQNWLAGIDISSRIVGTAIKNLHLSDMKVLAVPFPTLDEQTEIVRRVDTLFAFADRVEARCAAARKQAGKLTPALLAKAFRGELAPQDPADEPAAELLKRLAARRAEAPKTRRGRKPVAAGE